METTINETYINVIVNALRNALNELNAENAKKTFENLKAYKKELDNETAFKVQKMINSKLTKLEIAQLKQLCKTGSKNIGSSERAKQNFNILITDVQTQMKKTKNALSNYLTKNVTDKYELKYIKSDVLTEFDKVTENEFQTLYTGGLLQIDKVYRYIINRIEKTKKASK